MIGCRSDMCLRDQSQSMTGQKLTFYYIGFQAQVKENSLKFEFNLNVPWQLAKTIIMVANCFFTIQMSVYSK